MLAKKMLSIARQSTAHGDNISNDVQKQSNDVYINNLSTNFSSVTTSETIGSAYTRDPGWSKDVRKRIYRCYCFTH